MEQARADEAWYVLRGKEPIIVIDTGIDINHEDLKNKIDTSKAYNTADGNTDVRDFVHHGSHISGIAAAQSNNGLGMASVAWDSPIIPIKMFPGKTHKNLSPDLMVRAIDHVTTNLEQQKIINYSTGFEIPEMSLICAVHVLEVKLLGIPVFLPPCIEQIEEIKDRVDARGMVCNAVNAAIQKDKIIVAAAGDSDSTKKVYPAACNNVISVAAVEPSDPLNFTLNPVRWVGIPTLGACPRTNIQVSRLFLNYHPILLYRQYTNTRLSI